MRWIWGLAAYFESFLKRDDDEWLEEFFVEEA